MNTMNRRMNGAHASAHTTTSCARDWLAAGFIKVWVVRSCSLGGYSDRVRGKVEDGVNSSVPSLKTPAVVRWWVLLATGLSSNKFGIFY